MSRSALGICCTWGFVLGVLLTGCGGSGGGSQLTPKTNLSVNLLSPGDGAFGVAVNTPITAKFESELDPATVTPATFTLFQGANQIPASVSVSGKLAQLFPSVPLQENKVYKASLSTQVKDINGESLKASLTWVFSTVNGTLPYITSQYPFNGVTNVSLDSPITVIFSEPMDVSTINTGTFTLNLGNTGAGPVPPSDYVAGSVIYLPDEQKAVFTPTLPLLPFQEYTVKLSGIIADLQGNTLGNVNWYFKTGYAGAPTVVSTIPGENALDVPTSNGLNPTTISIQFSHLMDPATLNNPMNFAIVDELGNAINGDYVYSNPIVTFTPTAPYNVLLPNMKYTITLTGVKDFTGTGLVGNVPPNYEQYVFSFTTKSGWGSGQVIEAQADDAQQPQILFDPVAGVFRTLWQQRTSGSSDYAIFMNSFSVYPDMNATLQLSVGSGDAANPQMIIDPATGDLYLVWQQKVNGENNYSIVFDQYSVSQGWGAPTVIDTNAANALNPQLALASDAAVGIVWQQSFSMPGYNSVSSVYYREYQSANQSWSSPVVLSNIQPWVTNQEAVNPSIAPSVYNNFMISFVEKNVDVVGNGTASPYFLPFVVLGNKSAFAGNGTFQINYVGHLAFMLSDSNAANIKSIFDPVTGNVGIIFQQKGLKLGPNTITNNSILMKSLNLYASAGEEGWSSPPAIVSSGALGEAQTPEIALDNAGNFIAVWKQQAGASSAFNLCSKTRPPIGTWSAISYLDADGATAGLDVQKAKLAVAFDGTLHITFCQKTAADPNAWSIFVNQLPANGSWGLAQQIESQSGEADNPQIALDLTGKPTVIFQQQIDSGSAAYSILINSPQ